MISTRTSNRRLLKLADFLEALPPERFNYQTWAGPDWQGAQDLSCGTTACALGWAAAMPAFRRLGLRLGWRTLWSNRTVPSVMLKNNSEASELEAAAEVFGLDYDEADHLFVNSRLMDASAQEVANHMREFVTEREVA